MSLDVFVVKMKHVDTAIGVVREFLVDLIGDLDWASDKWAGGWEGNSFFETYRHDLENRARDYATKNGLSSKDAVTLAVWIASLPWEGDDIMLTMNW